MPGKRITDHQVLKYKDHRKTLSQTAAAAKVAISERSARRIERADHLPSQRPPRRGETLHVLPHRDADLDRFLKELGRAWKSGEVRPTHRVDARPERYWRTRPDPFEAVWPRVVLWLESEPDRTAKELPHRLRAEGEDFIDGQPRTLQRRVKQWRLQAARRLVFASSKSQYAAVGVVRS